MTSSLLAFRKVTWAINIEELTHFCRINSHAALDIGAYHTFGFLDQVASEDHHNPRPSLMSGKSFVEEWSIEQHPP